MLRCHFDPTKSALATPPCNATLQCYNHATLQRNNHATSQRNNNTTLQRTITQSCNATITQPCKNQNCNVVVDLLDLEKQN
jgi:hypothetical protein